MSAPERSTAFCFTINNATDEDHRLVMELSDRNDVIYLIAEDETGEQNTPHIQGYIKFSKRVYRNALNIWLNRRAHIERAKASPQQNFKYCSKDNAVFVSKGFEEEQLIPRKDKEQAMNLKAQAILKDIAELSEKDFIIKHTHWFLTHRKDYLQFKTDFEIEKLPNYEGDLKQKNYWLYGSAGSGKSILPSKWTDNQYICRKTSNKWFDGYQKHHEIIVIDDIAPGINDQTARNIKNLADRYKFIVEIKNGTKVISPDDYCLIITTNYQIEQIFTNAEDIEPIKRRFTFINTDDAKKLNAEIAPPPYLKIIQQRRKEIPGQSIIDAIKEIGREVNQPHPEAEVEKYLSTVQSLHNKHKEEIEQRNQINDERKLRHLTRSQRKARYKEQGFSSSDAEIIIDREDADQDTQDPHPIFQGSQSESETEDWIKPQCYKPSEVEISKFSDVTESETEEDEMPSYDCTKNHSQSIRTDDPLLDLLNQSSEESSTEIDLSTSSE